jgi:hypothetical protein
METKVYCKDIYSNISIQDIEVNVINTERKPRYEKTFYNRITGEKFNTNDVKISRFKRNQILEGFYNRYNEVKYSWIEIGFDFKTTTRIGDVLLKVKRNLNKINSNPLSYVWLVDKGETYGNMHFHLLVAVDRIEIKGQKLPKELILTFKQRKVHSSFVGSKKKMINYLKKKSIFYIGKRKRVYGKSREKKQIEKN